MLCFAVQIPCPSVACLFIPFVTASELYRRHRISYTSFSRHKTVLAIASSCTGCLSMSMYSKCVLCSNTCHHNDIPVCYLQIQRCSLELTLPSLLHASVGLSEHGAKEFLSDSNMFVVYLEHMVRRLTL